MKAIPQRTPSRPTLASGCEPGSPFASRVRPTNSSSSGSRLLYLSPHFRRGTVLAYGLPSKAPSLVRHADYPAHELLCEASSLVRRRDYPASEMYLFCPHTDLLCAAYETCVRHTGLVLTGIWDLLILAYGTCSARHRGLALPGIRVEQHALILSGIRTE